MTRLGAQLVTERRDRLCHNARVRPSGGGMRPGISKLRLQYRRRDQDLRLAREGIFRKEKMALRVVAEN